MVEIQLEHLRNSSLCIINYTHTKKNDRDCCYNYLGLVIFQPVRLIYNQTSPLNGAEHSLVNGNQFIGCEQNMKLDR